MNRMRRRSSRIRDVKDFPELSEYTYVVYYIYICIWHRCEMGVKFKRCFQGGLLNVSCIRFNQTIGVT